MAGYIAAVAETVAAAVVQEVVSRTVSVVLGKRKDKASQGQYMERLTKAVHEVEFVLERTGKMPITEVSLLRDRIELKRDFIEAAALVFSSRRHEKRQPPQGQPEISQSVVTHSSSPHGWCHAMFSVSSFIGMMTTKEDELLCLNCDDVERFEQFADSARNILRRVESGCSLRRYMFFPCPLVRRLFAERKTLIYRKVQAGQGRYLAVWPSCFQEERGVEALVWYLYTDHKRSEKSFFLGLLLRLSESTDIVGVAMKCMQSLASQFNLVADTAMGELTLLTDLQDVSESDAPPGVGIQEWHSEATQMCRRDPSCCKGHVYCANNTVTSSESELSHVFPEEVIVFSFQCSVSAPQYSLRSSANESSKGSVTRNMRPPSQLTVCFAPHYVEDEQQQVIGDN
jgi:hypothetical protein